MLKKIIVLIVFIPYLSLFSQTPSYNQYTSSQGLASSTVYDILQDREGFIWLATLNGLSRFDSKHFTTFTMNEGLNSNVITSLLEGDKGEIYIANYEKGINVLSNGRMNNYLDKINGKSFNTTFLQKSNGKIFAYAPFGFIVVTNQNTIKSSSNSLIKPYEFLSKRPSFLQRLAKLQNDSLVALTSEGIFRIKDSKLSKMHIEGLPDSDLYCLSEASDGSLFIGAKGCVYKVKNNRVIQKYSMEGYNGKMFFQIYCDKKDNVWFTVLGKGFFVIPNGSNKIINLGNKMGLENTQVNCFFEDIEGNIWIGTYGKGVYCLNNLYLRTYTENEGLNNNNIICMEKVKGERLIIGTINGICILENGTIDRVKDKSGKVLSGYINSIKSYDDYVYVCWASDTPELEEINYKGIKFRFVRYQSFIKTSDNQYIYGGIGNDLRILNEYQFRLKNKFSPVFGDSSFQNRVNAIAEDSKKNIWIGTSLGLCKLTYEAGKKDIIRWEKTFFAKDPVLGNKINSIYEDKNGKVWFAGSKGIAFYNLKNNSVTSYTKILNSELTTPTSIVSDNKNRYWIGTMKGLYLLEGNSIKLLNSNTGLPSNEILSLYYDSNKYTICIGTSNGLSFLNIDSYDNYIFKPPLLKMISVKGGDSLFTNYSNLVFTPEQHNVYINFMAINYSSSGSVKYKYSLNGEWIETDIDFLNFISLKNGDYKLEIMAKSQNSDWSKPYYLNFTVLPKFVETIWFYLMIILLIVCLHIFIILWRIKVINNKRREELDLSERINELKHQALSAMMNPHFIFNALNSVQYLINYNKNEEANDYIAMMAKLIRKNLDGAGKGFILLSEEINRLTLYLNLEKLRFQESFSYEIIAGLDVDTDSVMIPNMIIQPFVENTLWHGIINSGIKGVITISFYFEDVEIDSETSRCLIIKVTDNGIGIENAKKNKKDDHISQGIQIIEERLRLLSTKMNLPKPIMFEDLGKRNDNSQGTVVIISLPKPLYKINPKE